MQAPTADFFSSAFVHSAVGMALVGLHGRWLDINPALCRMLGYPRDQLMAFTFKDITYPEDLPRDLELLDQVLAEEIECYHLEKRYCQADGSIIWGLLTVSLARNDAGRPECLLAQVIDITPEKQAMAEREAFFALSPDLLAIADPRGFLIQVNPSWTEALGWSAQELTSRPFIDYVHPDDVARTLREAESVRQDGVAKGFRNRYRDSQGGYRWLEWNTRASSMGLLYCTVRDITVQLQNEERIRSQERKIRLLIDNANDAFLGMNEQGTITEWNKQAEATFGWSAEEAIGQPMSELLTPQRLRQRHHDGVSNFLLRGRDQLRRKRVEVPALRKDGSEIMVEITVGVLPVAGEQYFHAFLRDISEQRKVTEQLHYRATHDFLTGLPNRYEFMSRLQHAIGDATRAPRPLVLLFIDLDGFKAVNDLCGHEAGDAVLTEFGRRLEQAVRRTDLVARLAGDEFMVLFDHFAEPAHDALEVSRKILDAAGQPYPQTAGHVELGASIGVAHYQEGDTPDSLLSRADASMYIAKNAGKNRVAVLRDGAWVVSH